MGVVEKGEVESGTARGRESSDRRSEMMQVGKGNQNQNQNHIHRQRNHNREMNELQDMLSNLNPLAQEFVPPSLLNHNHNHIHNQNIQYHPPGPGYFVPNRKPTNSTAFGLDTNIIVDPNHFNFNANANANAHVHARRKKHSDAHPQSQTHVRRKMNARTSMVQRDEIIGRTVYVSDIDHQVTEEQLASLFINCGQVVDCRICGDPNSVLRFAFVEFTDKDGALAALTLSGTMLGFYPVKVLPSKTAIAPVNPTFLPQSEDEREMCARTIYCTNIDKKVSQAQLKLFFQSVCGEVHRLRVLGDYHHSTRIAFVEFVMAESAIAALSCSGVVLGSLAIRVSPSKTPVRPRAPRQPMH